ncbi:high-affinity branched-chain amino acid ABC transporter permease LivM [Fulvimarina sp. 2208YS6-2-32]|uniref:High-affinity branched-chain amino acid ABC transporter permease LivM n=1 Tax=Fulvimarina uroteuthidis TaxID=3098149 RepID=A0ABU5I3K3_9HYPH|nr:high-affinity branched-chain amino acid ABC transporter permease LivM [Fulvimarina sp. 2208YS6-2-32]MDY8109950.1 high-affinity branched-chain amino acid ABC transporter permease LivM [Fulvimarina sp. 2208YS6-2-32]
MATTTPPTASNRPEGAELESEARRDAMRGEPPFTETPAEDSRLVRSLKEAGITATLVGALTIFFFVFRTDIATGGLDLTLRPGLWFAWIGVAFVGRFLLSFFIFRASSPITSYFKRPATGRKPLPIGKVFGIVMLLVAIFLPFLLDQFLPRQNRYLLDLAILILTYVMLGWGLNIVVGLAGLLDLGYVAFYAVGAYSFALLSTNFGLGFWVCLPMAGLFAALWGVMLGFPVLRLRGDYLAIVTLAFGEIIRVVLLNWYEFTGGPNGLLGIPKPTLFGLEFNRGEGGFADYFGLEYSPVQRFVFLYYIILALALFTNFVTMRMRKLPVGRAWEALREDEIACRALGINTVNVKLTAFATGAMFGGFAGSFFATRQGFISPESFTFIESAIILAIVVLGGLGSQLGVVIASVVMIGGIELLRNLTILEAVFGAGFDPTQYRMLIFGLAMVAIMVWKPRGLISTRVPSVFYKEKKKIGADLVSQGEGH